MKTLTLFAHSKFTVPATTAWYLESLGEFRGKQELYTRQSPQKLRVLRGMEVGRYISLERRIEENKERYYQTLEQCSVGWHEGRHDPWPFINYILSILKLSYQEFEERVGQVAEPKGAKAELVRDAVLKREGEFRLRDIEQACPSVGREWIRNVLAEMQEAGELQCTGRGVAARWKRTQGR